MVCGCGIPCVSTPSNQTAIDGSCNFRLLVPYACRGPSANSVTHALFWSTNMEWSGEKSYGSSTQSGLPWMEQGYISSFTSIMPERGGCREMGMSTEPCGGGYREEGLKISRIPMVYGGAIRGNECRRMMRGDRGPRGQRGSFLRNEIGRRGPAATRSVQGCFIA